MKTTFKKAKKTFADYIDSTLFTAGIGALFFNPFYFARKGLIKGIGEFSGKLKGEMLDVGCGNKPYKKMFSCEKYVGLEINTQRQQENKNVDFFYDGKTFPFNSKKFDSVFCSEVLEHVFEPFNFIDEINRVLKIDGKLLLTVPFVWNEHEQPYDYGRYSSFGISHLLEKHGFKIIGNQKTGRGITTIIQLTTEYIRKATLTKSYSINLLLIGLISAPINIIGSILALILPKGQDLFIDNVILAQKISDI